MLCQKQNNIDLPEIEIITFRQNTDILPKKSICSSFQIFQTLHFLNFLQSCHSLTLSPRSSDKFRLDQTQNFGTLIFLQRPRGQPTVFVCLPILRHWKIFKQANMRKHWLPKNKGTCRYFYPNLVILAEWDLVLSRYLAEGSNMSLGFRGRWISEEGYLSTSGMLGM